MSNSILPCNALILINSQFQSVNQYYQYLSPWLEHYGVPYETIDLLREGLPANLHDYPLVILGHPGVDDYGVRLGAQGLDQLRSAVKAGGGLVSFDPALSCRLFGSPETAGTIPAHRLEVRNGHRVTGRYEDGHRIELLSAIELNPIPDGEALIVSESGAPLLNLQLKGQGRTAHWANSAWMQSNVLGALGGLDSAFWRSLVWAARKPFCLRGFPPVVTMRVDDVAGWGELWQRSPLYWVEDAIESGFRPWLGLFLYNLNPTAIDQLREMLLNETATAFPHALGRPPRGDENYYYHPEALAPRVESYDEFIYFDHHRQVPWSDDEAERGLSAVEQWYRTNGPLPISRVALAHWYEMGANTASRVRSWGCEYIGKVMDFDLPLIPGTQWLRSHPFRMTEKTGDALPHTNDPSGKRPVYYADTLQVNGSQFFNSVTEIRDDAGYEWAPDNDVRASIGRAGRQLRRALDSMALASLFTHETDFIYKIDPLNWLEIIRGAAREIEAYRPVQMTLDDAMGLLRATRASRFRACRLDERTSELLVTFEGHADRETYFYVFRAEDDALDGELREVPAFDGFLLNAYPL